MDIDYFLRTKYEENQVEGVLRTEELYKNISNTYLVLCNPKRIVMDIIMLLKAENC